MSTTQVGICLMVIGIVLIAVVIGWLTGMAILGVGFIGIALLIWGMEIRDRPNGWRWR